MSCPAMRPGPGTFSTALAILTFTACADAAVPDGGITIDTIAGVVTIINRDSGEWSAGQAWRLGEPVRIGEDPMAVDAYAFGSITGLAVSDDARIYVADGQALEIRAFAADGTYLFSFGRSGEGPGEFAGLDALATSPDGHIVARDPRLFRVTRFTTDGEYVSDFRLQRPFPQYSGGLGFDIAEDGTLFDRLSITRGIESNDSLALIMYTAAGQVRDTLLVAESPRQFVSVFVDGVAQMGMPVPFRPFASVAVEPSGRIARTFGDTYEFDLLSADGRVLRSVRRAVTPVPVSARERDSTLAAMRQTAAEYTEGGRLDDFEFPTVKAAITHLFGDAAGNWWVGANNVASRLMNPAHMDVFSPEGRYLGRVAVPFRPVDIGADYVAGVSVDELGVESVTVAPLIKPAAER